MGFNGRIESKTTQVNSNRISVNSKHLENRTENFWKIDSYGITKDANPSFANTKWKNSRIYFRKNSNKNWWSLFFGTIMENEVPNLLNNRSLALSRFLSLEKKFKNNLEFEAQYQKTIKEYIEKRHATKLKMKTTQTRL